MLKEVLQAISSHPSLKIDPANCPSFDELTTTDTIFVQAAFQGDLSQVWYFFSFFGVVRFHEKNFFLQIKELVNKVDINCKMYGSQETAMHKAAQNGEKCEKIPWNQE